MTPDLWVELALVQDSISSDPGIVDIPLRSTWEGISFLKISLLQVINTVQSSVYLSTPQVQSLINHSLAAISSLVKLCHTKVKVLEQFLLQELCSLRRLLTMCSRETIHLYELTDELVSIILLLVLYSWRLVIFLQVYLIRLHLFFHHLYPPLKLRLFVQSWP